MSLVFYDTETTGTETFFDQILQFAAIRTDADLNEIDRFEVRYRRKGISTDRCIIPIALRNGARHSREVIGMVTIDVHWVEFHRF
jgi:hypothetical protein